MNGDIEIAWQFHNGTKHPNGALLNPAHTYDPDQRPFPYKVYKECIRKVPLKLDKSPLGISALEALENTVSSSEQILTLETISRIAFFAGGVTKVIYVPGLGNVEFRAASCTGALYHIEIYFVCGNDVSGLKAGVYHFDPNKMNFEMLREGDFMGVVAASTQDKEISHAAAVMLFTDVFTRNSVKYQAREYRHGFWDSGTIIANALAMCNAHRIQAKLILGYIDDRINFLLGLDSKKEVSLALVALGHSERPVTPTTEMSSLDLNIDQLSNYGYDDPAILRIHSNSCLHSIEEIQGWLEDSSKAKSTSEKIQSQRISLAPPSSKDSFLRSIESVIIRRGSVRRFKREPISFQQLSLILYYSASRLHADFVDAYGKSLVDVYVVANAVDGIRNGSYFYRHKDDEKTLEPLKYGEFRSEVGHLGLDQRLAYDCSASVFIMCDLDAVFATFGNRGYRAAMLEAGIMGGRIYLASHALGIGATGLTFYDDETADFFMPHSEKKSMMLLLAVGKRAKHKLI